VQWGDPTIIRERLGEAVSELTFDRSTMFHAGAQFRDRARSVMKSTPPPVIKWFRNTRRAGEARGIPDRPRAIG